uniref:Uncharacterized protein n=1 Tax=uncultured marine virus TaxID=186617 RepID=A0A0F7L6R5_9VIRU|nr:hypothetical protein [uncultured marine virus]
MDQPGRVAAYFYDRPDLAAIRDLVARLRALDPARRVVLDAENSVREWICSANEFIVNR